MISFTITVQKSRGGYVLNHIHSLAVQISLQPCLSFSSIFEFELNCVTLQYTLKDSYIMVIYKNYFGGCPRKSMGAFCFFLCKQKL